MRAKEGSGLVLTLLLLVVARVAGEHDPDDVQPPEQQQVWEALIAPELLVESGLQHATAHRGSLPDFDVDFVYTWVDSSNAKHALSRESFLNQTDPKTLLPGAQSRERFTRHPQALRYALATARAFAPNIRAVHVVMSAYDHAPGWVHSVHPNVHVHTHHSLFPDTTHLPTFNSLAIECWLHRIPGLAEHFVYFNDDMLVGKPVDKALFFTPAGVPYFWPDNVMGRLLGDPRQDTDSYWATIRHTNNVLQQSSVAAQLEGNRWAYFVPEHQGRALTKSMLERAVELFEDVVEATSASRFRSYGNVWTIHLAYQTALATHSVEVNGHTEAGPFLFGMFTFNHPANRHVVMRLEESKHALFCVNRDADDPAADKAYGAFIQRLLKSAPRHRPNSARAPETTNQPPPNLHVVQVKSVLAPIVENRALASVPAARTDEQVPQANADSTTTTATTNVAPAAAAPVSSPTTAVPAVRGGWARARQTPHAEDHVTVANHFPSTEARFVRKSNADLDEYRKWRQGVKFESLAPSPSHSHLIMPLAGSDEAQGTRPHADVNDDAALHEFARWQSVR